MTPNSLTKDLTLPLIAAPMFLVSNPELVIAACENGVIGAFPALNRRTTEGLDEWLTQIETALQKAKTENQQAKIAPYAVNLIVNAANPRLQADLEICVKHKVPVIITSLGLREEIIGAIHAYGGLVLHDIATVYHARKAADAGVDGLIAVAAGAGGHAGTLNPFAFIGEIREFYDGLLILAGGLSHGKDILAAQIMGADLAYMGTRFIAATESAADPAYKQMVCDSTSAEIVYTPAISGVPGNFMAKSLTQAGFDLNELEKAEPDAKKLKLLHEEAKAWKTIWSAGQGVGAIHETLSTKDLVRRLINEYETALTQTQNQIKTGK
ncbi:MAG: nitronate monooxygenase [Rhodospirillales bacterium]|nr:nitronate monooxygenase [Rhodospirillales bacterium]